METEIMLWLSTIHMCSGNEFTTKSRLLKTVKFSHVLHNLFYLIATTYRICAESANI